MSDPPRGFPSWDELYRNDTIERLPWYYTELDPDLAAALDARGISSGRALDLGAGPGTQAIALALRGFDVTGVDVSEAAVDYAKRKAKSRGARVTFVRDDIKAPSLEVEGPFDFLFDRGCFHVLEPAQRAGYVATTRRLLEPGGFLFLKTFSHRQPGSQGPHRFTPEDLRQIFGGDRFEVVEIHESVFQGQLEPQPLALFATLRAR